MVRERRLVCILFSLAGDAFPLSLRAVGTTIGRPSVHAAPKSTDEQCSSLRRGDPFSRCERGDLFAFCFPLRGTGKQNQCVHQFLNWWTNMPYGMFGHDSSLHSLKQIAAFRGVFGKEDSVKETQEGCLSRSITPPRGRVCEANSHQKRELPFGSSLFWCERGDLNSHVG